MKRLARLRQGRLDEALAALEESTRLSAGSAEAWMLLGQVPRPAAGRAVAWGSPMF